jgi:phage tail tape-measure protein
MDREVQIWLIVLAAATAQSVTIQVGSLVGLYLGIRRLRAKIETICAAVTKGPSLPEIATSAQEALESANRVARNTAELIERIKPVVNETSILCQGQMTRANQVFSDVLTRVETISH